MFDTDNVIIAWTVALLITYVIVTPVLLLVFRIGNGGPFSTDALIAHAAWPVSYPWLAAIELRTLLGRARRWFVITDDEYREERGY